MPNDELLRRAFLARTGQFAALTLASPWWALGQPNGSVNPFTLGVASGDPAADGFVLWTRLAPDPLHGGGMPNERVEVEWKVAADEQMSKIVAHGRETATPDLAHSVHVEVRGLKPARWYWYQFRAGKHESIVGRTRTAPEPHDLVAKLSFAFVSCQHYETGYYTAYKHIGEEDLDAVVHLGDYIYEGAARDDRPRRHNGPEPTTLSAYRDRHALYRLDPDLQRVHALFPWIVTWDDHEVDNNYANDISEDNAPRTEFLERRAGAYQAYFEHMPLRRTSLPHGSSMLLYRRVGYGRLAEFSVLDGGSTVPISPAATALVWDAPRLPRRRKPCSDPCRRNGSWTAWRNRKPAGISSRIRSSWRRSITARAPRSASRWTSGTAIKWRATAWCDFSRTAKISNPVVITGDIHSNWVVDLKLDWFNPKAPAVGTEFVGTSITSGGDGVDMPPAVQAYLPENPQVHFFNAQRGYVRCVVTPERWQSDYRVVPYVSRPGAPISTRASFVVENGRAGAQRA